jgi:hypothetical protein
VNYFPKTPPAIDRTISTSSYDKNPLLVERSKSSLSEKAKVKHAFVNSYNDEIKQLPVRYNVPSYITNNNDSKNTHGISSSFKTTPNEKNSKLNVQKFPIKYVFNSKKDSLE